MGKQQFLDLPGLNVLVNELKAYIANEKVLTFPTKLQFPTVGKVSTIYIDLSDNMIYRWDDDNIKYYSLGFNPENIEVVDGGSS